MVGWNGGWDLFVLLMRWSMSGAESIVRIDGASFGKVKDEAFRTVRRAEFEIKCRIKFVEISLQLRLRPQT